MQVKRPTPTPPAPPHPRARGRGNFTMPLVMTQVFYSSSSTVQFLLHFINVLPNIFLRRGQTLNLVPTHVILLGVRCGHNMPLATACHAGSLQA